MTRQDIARTIAETSGVGLAEALAQVDAVLEAIMAGTLRGEVALAGFGKFRTTHRPQRTGRNPRTGDPLVIAPSVRIGFSAAKAFKDRAQR